DMHRAGRVGGYKLNQNLFAAAKSGTAVAVFLIQDMQDILREPFSSKEEVDETRTSDFYPVKAGAGEVHCSGNSIRNHLGRLAESTCRNHCRISREVTVRDIRRDFDIECGQLSFRERTGIYSGSDGLFDQLPAFLFYIQDGIYHDKFSFQGHYEPICQV